MSSLRIRMVWFLIAFLLVSVASCTQQASEKPSKKKKAHLVEAVEVKQSALSVEQVRNGTLRARREVEIHNQEVGEVIQLPYFEGDSVKKGDMLVRLDDKLLRAQLARALATRLQAEQDLKRTRNLYKKKLVSDEELSRTETALQVAKADEEILATRLSYTVIESPINGIVSARYTEPGNIAERHTHLLTISDPTSLVTEVTLSELLITKLSVNDQVDVSIDALGDKTFKGRIRRIYPNLDPVTRRGTLEVELKPVPEGARPGQLCRIRLSTQAAERLVIPFKALRRDQKGEYVFAIDEQKRVKRIPIVGGLRIGEQLEVLNGLSEGQQVVTKGFLDLVDGKKVKVVSLNEKKKSQNKESKQSAEPAGQ